jgi:hypothetical protein
MMKQSQIAAAAIALVLTGAAQAAVSPEDAAKLKTSLTPFGAEKAGSKDGMIPAWTGGYTTVAPGYKSGAARPDPFASEKPTLAITGANAAQYDAKLTDGVKALLKKYPSFRLDVYPTHRSAAAPQWVYDNTFKNATRAKTTAGGYGIEGAIGGIPFPVPKDGYEVMWNARLSWVGESVITPMRTWVVNPGKSPVLASEFIQTVVSPYYYKDNNLEKFDGIYKYLRVLNEGPASKAGQALLIHENVDSDKRAAWQYLVGQRRVRRAPSISYDTPDFVTSGIGFFDEAFMLLGPIDHHSLKLVGKQELYVPYNNNRAAGVAPEKLLTPNFLNPDLVRWEAHRVWVVQADLIPGKRHVVPKRRYYIDEDTWQILWMDGWDAQGALWRSGYALTLLAPDLPAVTSLPNHGNYNLQTGAYFLNESPNGFDVQYKNVPRQPESSFSPEDLANSSTR